MRAWNRQKVPDLSSCHAASPVLMPFPVICYEREHAFRSFQIIIINLFVRSGTPGPVFRPGSGTSQPIIPLVSEATGKKEREETPRISRRRRNLCPRAATPLGLIENFSCCSIERRSTHTHTHTHTHIQTHIGEQRHQNFRWRGCMRCPVAEERGVSNSKRRYEERVYVCVRVLRMETGLESLRTATRAGRRPAKSRSSRTAAVCVAPWWEDSRWK